MALVLEFFSNVPATNVSNGGTIANVRIAEKDRPPNTTDPKPLYNSDPEPGKRTKGIMPKILVNVDIKIGRIRFRVASRIEISTLMPSSLI